MRYAIVSGLGQDFVPGQSYTGVIGTGAEGQAYSVVPQSNDDPAQMAREVVKPATKMLMKSFPMRSSGLSPAMDLAHKAFMVAGGAALVYVLWSKFGKK
jgi:hypothetical protein